MSALKKPVDKFLENPDDLFYEIHCWECRSPLWRSRILKRSGDHVVSTETHACDPAVGDFSYRIQDCPICRKCFYTRNHKNGGHLYLIKDLKSGITRLI